MTEVVVFEALVVPKKLPQVSLSLSKRGRAESGNFECIAIPCSNIYIYLVHVHLYIRNTYIYIYMNEAETDRRLQRNPPAKYQTISLDGPMGLCASNAAL